MLVQIWERPISVYWVLDVGTAVSVAGYLVLLLYFLLGVQHQDGTFGHTVSDMIAYNKGTTVTAALLIFAHSYVLTAYLVLISDYIHYSGAHFKIIAVASYTYIAALVVMTYLPVHSDENPHNVFAGISSGFALISTWAHKNSFYHGAKVDAAVLFADMVVLAAMTTAAALFWFNDSNAAEYVFILIVLLDKKFKLLILERGGFADDLRNAALRYSFWVPPRQVPPVAVHY